MRFAFQVTRADYLDASHVLGRRHGDSLRPVRWWGLCTVAIGFLLLTAGVPYATRIGPVVLMATGLFVVLYPIWIAYGQAEKSWAEHEPLVRPTTISVDDQGISFSTPVMNGTWRWEGIVEFQETRQSFLLFASRTELLTLIPKRGLESADELRAFRSMLETRVTGPSTGFPVVQRDVGAGPTDDPQDPV